MEICHWCGHGFEPNEPRALRNGNKVFHILSKAGRECIEEYRTELRRILKEENRRRKAFEKM